MPSIDQNICNFLKRSSSPNINLNINHFQYLRKQKSQRRNEQNLFSNNLLRCTVASLNNCKSIIQKKLQTTYSPRKVLNSNAKTIRITNKIAPYKQAADEAKKIQEYMLNSFQKSLTIARHPICENKSQFFQRTNQNSIHRSQSALILRDYVKRNDEQKKIYQKIAFINPQSGKIPRIIESACNLRAKTTKIRNFSELSQYMKGKNGPQQKMGYLYSENLKINYHK